MAKLSLATGTTSKLLDVFIQNSSSTVGAGLTGLAYNTSGLTAYYYREGASSSTAITLATQTLGTWATGGFVVVDGTNMPGVYQLAIPNAALVSGAPSVVIYLQGAANMAPLVLEIELTAVNNQSATSFMTGINALAPPTNWNVTAITSGGVVTANATQFAGQTITAAAGVTLPSSVASPTNITAGTITTVTNLTNAASSGDFTSTMKTSIITAATAATPTAASVTGSVGSVSGVTFPSVVASPTNITAGTITTVTNLTNAPTSGDLTATMKASVTTAATASTPVAASVTGAVGSVTGGVTVTTNNDKSGYALSTAGVTAIWSQVMTGTTTAAQAMKGFLAVLLGKASGMATTTAVFRDIADTTNVVTATVDANGNRTAVTVNLS